MWRDELKKVEQCPQRQDSAADQLNDLWEIANRFGFYDAADFIRRGLSPEVKDPPTLEEIGRANQCALDELRSEGYEISGPLLARRNDQFTPAFTVSRDGVTVRIYMSVFEHMGFEPEYHALHVKDLIKRTHRQKLKTENENGTE